MTNRADDVEQAILTLLDGCGAERLVHAEARSAPEAAAARGTPLQRGGQVAVHEARPHGLGGAGPAR
jgi:hypothetical protein